MKIFVRYPPDNIVSVEVENADTIESVKEKLEYKIGIPVHQQRLLLGINRLLDYHTVQDYNLKNEDTLHVYRNPKGYLKIYIILMDGKILPLDAEIMDTIELIKTQIKDKTRIHPAIQCLKFEGRELQNNHTLLDFVVPNGAVIELSTISLD